MQLPILDRPALKARQRRRKVLVGHPAFECEPWPTTTLMDDDFFPFAVTPIISPQRPKPCVPAVEDDSDDEFCMPQASSKPARDPATVAVGSGASLGPQCPTSAKGSVDEGSSLPGGEAASASGDGTGISNALCFRKFVKYRN